MRAIWNSLLWVITSLCKENKTLYLQERSVHTSTAIRGLSLWLTAGTWGTVPVRAWRTDKTARWLNQDSLTRFIARTSQCGTAVPVYLIMTYFSTRLILLPLLLWFRTIINHPKQAYSIKCMCRRLKHSVNSAFCPLNVAYPWVVGAITS